MSTESREKEKTQYENLRNKKEIRSYEVSVWTLQDSFITVLKWSDVEQQGRIENPKMKLNIDGTELFSFSIPMYYHQKDGTLVENPNWYNTRNGNLMINLRKIKVIFNKGTEDKAVYEFIISKITETHEKDILTCEVECEGLAFNELGKIGYKYDLSPELFYNKYNEWYKNPPADGTGVPHLTLDYWCQEVLGLTKWNNSITRNPSLWYYKVEMNWKAFHNAGGRIRDTTKIYEEEYVSAWDIVENRPVATLVESYREKERPISINNSNLYNITQTIAETFEVFCRYEYGHDDNNHITSRTIVFYNNFFKEEDGIFSFTYPYSSSKISREADSDNLTTKLFILDTEDNGTLSGLSSIIDADNNFSLEDYILNFDYLYNTKTITKELYASITPYETKMRDLNSRLRPLQLSYSIYLIDIAKMEALIKVYEESIELAKKLLTQNAELKNALDKADSTESDLGDGYISITENNPCFRIILTDKDKGKYINLNPEHKGIKEDTIRIYTTYNTTSPKLTGEITLFTPDDYDKETGFATKLYINDSNITDSNTYLYLTYKYDPHLYYDTVIKIWEDRELSDTENKEKLEAELGQKRDDTINQAPTGMYKISEDLDDKIQELLEELKVERIKFEQLMGPALREGYWLPEKYNDYGEGFEDTLDFSIVNADTLTNNRTVNTKKGCKIVWDSEIFDNESKNYYQTLSKPGKRIYYPTIDLSNAAFSNIISNITDYYVVFNTAYSRDENGYANGESWDQTRFLQYFAISGSEYDNNTVGTTEVSALALLEYTISGNTIKPILVLVGTLNMTDELIKHMLSDKGHAQFRLKTSWQTTSLYNIPVRTWDLNNNITSNGAWMPDGERAANSPAVTIYRPRIKFSSMSLKTSSSNLYLRYNNILFEEYKHYSITTLTTDRILPNFDVNTNAKFREYFITLKPLAMMRAYAKGEMLLQINYVLSNANSTIYLDALKVSKENAIPKVSYDISPNILNRDLTSLLYTKLAHIVMINDTDLKFENVFGYISGIEMDLDDMTKDSLEIKNYKTKFEDLFSSIVALTESMKRAGVEMYSAFNGDTPLSTQGFATSLMSAGNMGILNAYLDSHFDTSEVITKKLTSLFAEAAVILSDTLKSLNSVSALSQENAKILDSFALRIRDEMTPKVYKLSTRPATFKTGDIWILTGEDELHNLIIVGRYVATTTSGSLIGTSGNPNAGFVRTYDGTLASITGASLDIDADHGNIDIKAKNNINIMSGKDIYIAADAKVDIVGNESVNIGGTTINIAATSSGSVGGINIINTSYNTSNITGALVAKVLISPDEITMAGSKITMYAGNSDNTAALTINPTSSDSKYGIWMGSSKAIGISSTNNGVSSLIKLDTQLIIMGVSSGMTNTAATVFELTNDYLILGSGLITDESTLKTKTITTKLSDSSNPLTGMKLTKDSFGISVGSGSSRSVVLINSSGIDIGSGEDPKTDGSYVSISGSGVDIGSLGNLYVNMNNFKLQTDGNPQTTRFAVGSGLLSLTLADVNSTTPNTSFVGIVYNANGLYINGNVYASTFIAPGNSCSFKATSDSLGFYASTAANAAGILTISSNAITASLSLTIASGNNLTITSGSLTLSGTSSLSLNSGNITMTSGNLTLSSGTLTVTSGNISISGVMIDNKYDAKGTGANEAKAVKDGFTNGTTAVKKVSATGITITDNSLTISSTATINITANGSILLATSVSGQTGNAVSLSGTGVQILSGGELLVNTNNVVIDSKDANSDNTIFELKGIWSGNGTTSGTFLRMNKKYGGFFAGWNFNLGWIWSGSASTCVTICGSNTVTPAEGNEYVSTTYTTYVAPWAFYCGANWAQNTPSTLGSGWAPCKISKNGFVYSNAICIGTGPHNITNSNGPEYYSGTLTSTTDNTYWNGLIGKLRIWVKTKDLAVHQNDKNETIVDLAATWTWVEIDGTSLARKLGLIT